MTTDSQLSIKKVYVNQVVVSQWAIKQFELNVSNDVREKLIKNAKAPEKSRSIGKAEIFFASKLKDGRMVENLNDKQSYLLKKVFHYILSFIVNANFLTNGNGE